MKNSAATAHIRELGSLGLASELLIPALLEALHRRGATDLRFSVSSEPILSPLR